MFKRGRPAALRPTAQKAFQVFRLPIQKVVANCFRKGCTFLHGSGSRVGNQRFGKSSETENIGVAPVLRQTLLRSLASNI